MIVLPEGQLASSSGVCVAAVDDNMTTAGMICSSNFMPARPRCSFGSNQRTSQPQRFSLNRGKRTTGEALKCNPADRAICAAMPFALSSAQCRYPFRTDYVHTPLGTHSARRRKRDGFAASLKQQGVPRLSTTPSRCIGRRPTRDIPSRTRVFPCRKTLPGGRSRCPSPPVWSPTSRIESSTWCGLPSTGTD